MQPASPTHPPASSSRFLGVQALRAVAALLVVLFHLQSVTRVGFGVDWQGLSFGAAGVDLFFVISGFVMVVTATRAQQGPGAARDFMARRLNRIVPLYWLVTASKLALTLAVPRLAVNDAGPAWHSVASFLFIPAWNARHEAYPVILQGWTLSFEMLFYLLFAAALALRLNPLRWLPPVLLGLAAVGLNRTEAWGAPATLLHPLLLEFVLGMAVGTATLSGRRLPAPLAAAALGLGAVVMAGFGGHVVLDTEWPRVAVCGFAGALIVAGTVALEPMLAPHVPRLAIRLGDASYALYLTHGFVVVAVGGAARYFGLMGPAPAAVALAVATVTACVLALLVFENVERPLGALTRRRGRRLAPPPTGGALRGV